MALDRTALVGVGSNLGDRRAHLERAVRMLSIPGSFELARVSGLYETEPVGGPPQGSFLNACARFRTSLGAPDILDHLLFVEHQLGRVRGPRFGPRTVDLDLLLLDALVVDTTGLKLPHPRMLERAFVMVPAVEIAAAWVHPLALMPLASLMPRQVTGVRHVSGPEWFAPDAPPAHGRAGSRGQG